MKKYILSLALLICTGFVYAQNCSDYRKSNCYTKCEKRQSQNLNDVKPSKKWKISGFGASFGASGDSYANMTKEGMASMAINMPSQLLNVDGYEQTIDANEFMVHGGQVGAFAVLSRDNSKEPFMFHPEFRFSLNATFDREAMFEYTRTDEVPTSSPNSVIYCLIENEVNFTASYIARMYMGERFSIYGGAGLNAGTTFNNIFLLIQDQPTSTNPYNESTTEVEAKSSYYTRGLIHVGATYHTRGRLSFNFDMQSGAGLQIIDGSSNNLISEVCAGSLGIQYNLFR